MPSRASITVPSHNDQDWEHKYQEEICHPAARPLYRAIMSRTGSTDTRRRHVIPRLDRGIQYNMSKTYYTYILASKRNGTLYAGVTSDLIKRVFQHRTDQVGGFTRKYKVHWLVYFEQHVDVIAAIHREKRLKEWQRKWKLALIEKSNPLWMDLYFEITGSRGLTTG